MTGKSLWKILTLRTFLFQPSKMVRAPPPPLSALGLGLLAPLLCLRGLAAPPVRSQPSNAPS